MTTETPKSRPDLSELFDVKRAKPVQAYVKRFEELFRQRDAISADIKQLSDEIVEDEFTPVEAAAMKDIAKWRQGDKALTAAAKLAALRRVSNAVKLDLFSWADAYREDNAA